MPLPKIDMPIFELTIPSTGKQIKVRPFVVKEEKLLLMASESKDVREVIEVTKQIINNCIIDGGEEAVNIDKLPFFDIDYLFIALRSKSIGENIDLQFKCNNIVEGEKCGSVFETQVDISKATVEMNDSVTDDIKVSDGKGIKMKYPNYATMKIIMSEESDIDKKIKLIANSIDYIYDKDQIYPAKDHTKEELIEFVEGMTEVNFKKLEYFVNNLPGFIVRLEAPCNSCGFVHKINYRDFDDFFI